MCELIRVDGVWLCPKLASTACGYVQAVGWHHQITALRPILDVPAYKRLWSEVLKQLPSCESQG